MLACVFPEDPYLPSCTCYPLQVLTFFSSLFGDLIESIIKRDAGMKVSSACSWHLAVSGGAARDLGG